MSQATDSTEPRAPQRLYKTGGALQPASQPRAAHHRPQPGPLRRPRETDIAKTRAAGRTRLQTSSSLVEKA